MVMVFLISDSGRGNLSPVLILISDSRTDM